MEEIIYLTQVLRVRVHIMPRGPHREALGSVMRQMRGETVGKSLDCTFCKKKWMRQVSEVRIG